MGHTVRGLGAELQRNPVLPDRVVVVALLLVHVAQIRRRGRHDRGGERLVLGLLGAGHGDAARVQRFRRVEFLQLPVGTAASREDAESVRRAAGGVGEGLLLAAAAVRGREGRAGDHLARLKTASVFCGCVSSTASYCSTASRGRRILLSSTARLTPGASHTGAILAARA